MAFRRSGGKGRSRRSFRRGGGSRRTVRKAGRSNRGSTLRIVIEQPAANPLARPEINGLTSVKGKKSTF